MKMVEYRQLSSIAKKALKEAEEAMENSYSPYSHSYVGAALFTKRGEIVTGAKFENAAFGSTTCAAIAAVLRANAKGMRSFSGIAIIDQGELFATSKVPELCGDCRQVLFELSQISGNNLMVVLSNTLKDKIMLTSIQELLPLGFGPKDLGVDISRYQESGR